MLCRNCYREIPDDSKFCRECGAKLGENGEVIEAPVAPVVENSATKGTYTYTGSVENTEKESSFDKAKEYVIDLWNEKRWLVISVVSAFAALIFIAIGVKWWKIVTDDRIKMPVSSSDLMRENYSDAVTILENAGFTNVRTEVIDDLILGWLTKDGEIERISIDGDTSFSSGEKFEKDSQIIVAYHTFPESRNKNRDNENGSSQSASDSYDVATEVAADDVATSEPANNYDDASYDYAATDDSSANENEKEEVESTLRSYIGKTVEEIKPVISNLGYDATYIAYNTGSDFTWDMNNVGKNDEGYMANVFKVKDIQSIDAYGKSVEIAITTDIIEGNEEKKEQQKSMEERLNDKLDVMNAWVAAESYGKSYVSPYKFKLKYFSGKLAEQADDEDTWFLKAYCEVDGVEYNCEANVTGTSDNPIVTYFQIY